MGIYIYIYIYICLSRFCACATHAQVNKNNNYLYIRAMGRHGFPGIPRRFGMQLPLVAICARHLR